MTRSHRLPRNGATDKTVDTHRVPAYEVLYGSAEDSFRTVQVHVPAHGQFYKVLEVSPIMLEGVAGWRVDGSDPAVPRATNARGGSKPLNAAIREGLVQVLPVTSQFTSTIEEETA